LKSNFGEYVLSKRELVTTEIELMAMAVAANIGRSL